MEKRYLVLNDTSGTYWNGALGISFRRDIPMTLESGPEVKMMLAKKVIREIDRNEFLALCAKHNIAVEGIDQQQEIIEPTLPIEATDHKNPDNQETGQVIGKQGDEKLPEIIPEVIQEPEAIIEPEPANFQVEVPEKKEEPVTLNEKDQPGEVNASPGADPLPEKVKEPEIIPEPEPIKAPEPEPLDPDSAREIIEKAVEKEIIAINRGWYKFGEVTLGKGLTLAIEKLISNPDIAIQIVNKLGN